MMSSKFTTLIIRNDVFDHFQAGGGGYGNPLERDPTAVLLDVKNEKVSPRAAREDYGVVIDANLQHVDLAATQAERAGRVS